MEIVWTNRADESFDKILDSIEKRFSAKDADKFIIKTYEVLDGIREFPRIYPESLRLLNVRKAVIHPHSTVFYQVRPSKIELLFFWDNRDNPAKIK